jgi:hypothetical protein
MSIDPCEARTQRPAVAPNPSEPGSLAGHLQYEGIASAECMVLAAVALWDGEMEITDMGDGQKRSRMPSATLMRWKKMLAITDAQWRCDLSVPTLVTSCATMK